MQTTTHQPHAYGSHPVAPLQYVTPTQLVVLTQPTVVVQAPAVQVHPGGRPWTTGLCGCTEDCCLCTYWGGRVGWGEGQGWTSKGWAVWHRGSL